MPTIPWETLNYEQQWRFARAAAEKRHQQIMALPNVVTLGVGVAYKNGKTHGIPCVTVSVNRKWLMADDDVRCIPRSLIVYEMFEGRRRRIKVPTDVVFAEIGELTGPAGGSPVAARLDRLSEIGTCCCMVGTTHHTTDRYLLGNHHVLGLTTEREPGNPTSIQCDHDGRHIGNVWALPVNPRRMDAAVAKINPAQIGSIQNSVRDQPSSIQLTRVLRSGHSPPYQMRIHTPSRILDCHFVDSLPRFAQPGYFGGEIYHFNNVLVLNAGPNHIQKGDSGSPITDGHDMLIGLLFARKKGDYRIGYAFFASHVLSAFSPELKLIP